MASSSMFVHGLWCGDYREISDIGAHLLDDMVCTCMFDRIYERIFVSESCIARLSRRGKYHTYVHYFIPISRIKQYRVT